MLQTRSISFQYNQATAFSYPDIEVENGKMLLILGNSGSGKTTFLHILAGLLKPNTGSVHVTERMEDLALQNDRFRGQHIGIIYQQAYFVSSLNVMQNLLVAQQMAGLKQDPERAKELLNRLGLSDKANKNVTELSIGEQQRVSIARALMNRPSVVLADEPTSSLDDGNCQKVAELLEQNCAEEKAALIIVTHDKRLVDRSDKVIRL